MSNGRTSVEAQKIVTTRLKLAWTLVEYQAVIDELRREEPTVKLNVRPSGRTDQWSNLCFFSITSLFLYEHMLPSYTPA